MNDKDEPTKDAIDIIHGISTAIGTSLVVFILILIMDTIFTKKYYLIATIIIILILTTLSIMGAVKLHKQKNKFYVSWLSTNAAILPALALFSVTV